MHTNFEIINISMPATYRASIVVPFSCEFCLRFPIHATTNATALIKLFRSYGSTIFRTALIRTNNRITISPLNKFLTTPLTNKHRFFTWLYLMIISIRTCLRTELSYFFAPIRRSKFDFAFRTFYKFVLRFYSTIPRTKSWSFFPSLVYKLFSANFACYFHMSIIP